MHSRRGEGLRSFAARSCGSPSRLSQNHLVQSEIRNSTPEPLVLSFKFLQPLELIAVHAAVFLAPSIVGLHRHADLTHSIRNRLSLTLQHFNLTQPQHDILGLLSRANHPLVLLKTG